MSAHRDAQVSAGIVVYRLDDRLFFASASYVNGRVREALRAAPTPARWLVFDAEAITHVDTAGLAAMHELLRDLRHDGVAVAVARMKSATRQRFDEDGLSDEIGRQRFYGTVRAAVEACEPEIGDLRAPFAAGARAAPIARLSAYAHHLGARIRTLDRARRRKEARSYVAAIRPSSSPLSPGRAA